VGVILFNHSDSDFAVKAGDRIAQLILERIAVAEVAEVEELSDTTRGAGGFGSTGVSGAAASPTAPASGAAALEVPAVHADKKQRVE
jgi:dUTP pyrophosphatase